MFLKHDRLKLEGQVEDYEEDLHQVSTDDSNTLGKTLLCQEGR